MKQIKFLVILSLFSCQALKSGNSPLVIDRNKLSKDKNLALVFFTATNCMPCTENLVEQLMKDSFTKENTVATIVYMGEITKLEKAKIDGNFNNYFKDYKVLSKKFKYDFKNIRFITDAVEYNTIISEEDFEKTPFIQLLTKDEINTYVPK
jgi:hypothetical protein